MATDVVATTLLAGTTVATGFGKIGTKRCWLPPNVLRNILTPWLHGDILKRRTWHDIQELYNDNEERIYIMRLCGMLQINSVPKYTLSDDYMNLMNE